MCHGLGRYPMALSNQNRNERRTMKGLYREEMIVKEITSPTETFNHITYCS